MQRKEEEERKEKEDRFEYFLIIHDWISIHPSILLVLHKIRQAMPCHGLHIPIPFVEKSINQSIKPFFLSFLVCNNNPKFL